MFQFAGLTKIVPLFAICQEAVSFLQASAGNEQEPTLPRRLY
jgi:hypothetical protein